VSTRGNLAIGQSGKALRLVLNGKVRDVEDGTTLPALLETLGIDRRTIAVAHNGEVIRRDRYDGVVLRDGDRVEVVRMVGGG
jgi:thiamine biosynthesis protein ThiS